jgi:formylglycine-generating enzyme required for sulfatase activity/tRNA A-37 threonylcarbamoyl transferase component Bud32
MDEELSPEELSALLTSYMPDIPGYRVLRRIGKGGMSYVYLGVQESLDRQVAIKVMAPEALADEKSKQRFEQEARTIAKLEHPCIVGIHEVGRTPQGLMFYVLPYLAKGHLGQRDFTQDEGRVTEVLRALLSALEYAHARGIVHRDVKAENVLFDNADRPLLTDFGIALSKRDSSRITTAGLAVGSGGYMAPEQARGEAVDGRADLYSVGVLAFELLSGRLPYLSSEPLSLALMHAQDPIPRLPAEKKHWQPLIDRAMAKAPDNRFRNAQQMLAALNQIAERGKAVVDSGSRKAAPAIKTAKTGASGLKPVLIGGGALVLLAVAGWMLWPKKPVSKPTDFYTAEPAKSPAASAAPAASPKPAASVPTPITDTASAPTSAGADPGFDDATAAAAASSPDGSAEASVAPVVAAPAPVVLASPSAAFTGVEASVRVTPLDYDPMLPGAREIAATKRQIAQKRISLPPGGNAIESLQAARKLAPENPELAPLSEQILAGLASALAEAVQANRDDNAKSLYQRGKRFAQDWRLLDQKPWKAVRDALPPLLVARLERATKAADGNAIDRGKALARTLEVDPKLLEPAWSKAELPAAAPSPVRTGGPAVIALRPGVAIMREEVSRGSYAEFASSSKRGAARCRNRLAPISIKKRSWADPGFAQGGNHPVVCVSFEDAQAYAQWLSERTGERYRLPTMSEWQQIANYRGSGDACRDGRIDCGGGEGTVPASQGAASPLGLLNVHGNVREWLGDCAGSCARHQVGGVGWRDSAARAEPTRASGFDSNIGYDDIGFRLVRE